MACCRPTPGAAAASPSGAAFGQDLDRASIRDLTALARAQVRRHREVRSRGPTTHRTRQRQRARDGPASQPAVNLGA
eukprot:1074928-Pyramimonas_sp.AAC.1